jgi:hypothetical protein
LALRGDERHLGATSLTYQRNERGAWRTQLSDADMSNAVMAMTSIAE